MGKLKIGVIGIGVIATTKHISNLLTREDIEVTALCDVDTEKCVKANKDFGLHAKIYTDYKELCENKELDVVHICTPNPLHCPMTLEALKNGKHVHCEKPIACTYADAQKMITAAKEAGKKLTSGLQWRYNAAPLKIKEMVQNGELGDIYYVKSQQLRPRRLPAYGVYTNKALNGGGVLMDGGPHSIDLPMWLTDNYEVESVRGVTFDKMKDFPEGNDLGPWDPENFDVEDTAMAMITMKNGMMIYMETAWITNMMQEAPGVIASIAGTKAGVDMVGPTFECSVRTTKIVDGKLTTEIKNLEEPVDMNAYDINHWIDAIQNGGEPAILPEQAATVTRVIEAIYESAATGKTIFFD
ncbi:Gfo/Idh/MocA family oxidoreductase [Faecalicatena orotica]|uniref:Putative dehydrogenase n=1 Tax=Faecalicatena orotica TaxID=1544 RepID=A0A2Y9CA42_9FIRM|nr:Gfo/Idh/MocA family oxidoreductase [Faecalicatena orotica]PWJ28941.1 putative dehydrogenase [Faecalicatena orotica]SSA56110.1 Predicted dehydrogenase [Faecalicatena orotica]